MSVLVIYIPIYSFRCVTNSVGF